MCKREAEESQRKVWLYKNGQWDAISLAVEKGDCDSRNAGCPLEAGKAKEILSYRDPPERNTVHPAHDFSSVKLVPDFSSQEPEDNSVSVYNNKGFKIKVVLFKTLSL